jgi:eukaryotic-like serine/threonine-protein kinase
LTIEAGTQLGHYTIVSRIGAGGMGEVWRATDTRLDRSVAIKVLPHSLADNEQFRARFEREARTISSLNHPHICTLYDVGHENGVHYLVMEYIEGESLADRLERGALPADKVVVLGAEIAEALDRAHRQGVVHRDVKPANVMLTKSGAKLLDFGLARSGAEASPLQGMTEMPTQARPLTQEGTILGTFQYMAPEQLEGQEADARTDIFALGALLYEMATGKRAFEGTSRTSLIAAIVSSNPVPISQLVPMTPPALDHVVRRCLEKDRDDRWQSAHDVASELRWISGAGSQAGVAAPITVRRKSRERLAWSLAAAALLAAIVTGVLLSKREVSRRVIESSIVTPAKYQVTVFGGVSISPDGQTAALSLSDSRAERSIWVRPLSAPAFRRLEGTEDAAHLFWSPDSRKIGFFANGELKSVDVNQGNVVVLADASVGRGASWSTGGVILFTPTSTSPLFSVPASGGSPTPLTKLRPKETSHRWPSFLPDGKTFVFLAANEQPSRSAVSEASLERPDEIKPLMYVASSAQFVRPNILLTVRGSQLVAQRFDPKRAAMIGEPVMVSDRIGVGDRFNGSFSSADDGTLLLQRGTGFLYSQLVWVDRSGKPEGSITEPGLFFSPVLSRDGQRLAVDVSSAGSGQGDIWIYELTRNASTRLTYDSGNESAPQWTPGDKQIVYFAVKNGRGDIYELPAGGTGASRLLYADEREKRPTDVSADGQWIIFNSIGGPSSGGTDIWVKSTSEKSARAWLATPFNELDGRISPDGSWIVYQSNESGRPEIYVRAFPDSDRKWMISSGGGTMPSWRGDGREIFYISPDRRMMAAPVKPGSPTFEVGAPVALFDARLRAHATVQYDVSRDGQRFLLNQEVQGEAEPVTMIQNWDVKLPR